jgi:hypothetical protein
MFNILTRYETQNITLTMDWREIFKSYSESENISFSVTQQSSYRA